MKKTGKILIGVLSVSALIGVGYATWYVSASAKAESDLTPEVETIVRDEFGKLNVTAIDNKIRFDAPSPNEGVGEDLNVKYNVMAEKLTEDSLDPYDESIYDTISEDYYPNLKVSTKAKRAGVELEETDTFFKYVVLPTVVEVDYKEWLLGEGKKDTGHDISLNFTWGEKSNFQNPQIAWANLSREEQKTNFESLINALDGVTFTFVFEVGNDVFNPSEGSLTGAISLPEVMGSTLTIDGHDKATNKLSAGKHNIDITIDSSDQKLKNDQIILVENTTNRVELPVEEVTLTKAGGRTFRTSYDFKADATYSFEYEIIEDLPPVKYGQIKETATNVTLSYEVNGKEVKKETDIEVGTEVDVKVVVNEDCVLSSLTHNDVDILETKKFKVVEGENLIVSTATQKVTLTLETSTGITFENGTATEKLLPGSKLPNIINETGREIECWLVNGKMVEPADFVTPNESTTIEPVFKTEAGFNKLWALSGSYNRKPNGANSKGFTADSFVAQWSSQNQTAINGDNGFKETGVKFKYSSPAEADSYFRADTKAYNDEVPIGTHTYKLNYENFGDEKLSFDVYFINSGSKLDSCLNNHFLLELEPGQAKTIEVSPTYSSANGNILTLYKTKTAIKGLDLGVSMSVKYNTEPVVAKKTKITETKDEFSTLTFKVNGEIFDINNELDVGTEVEVEAKAVEGRFIDELTHNGKNILDTKKFVVQDGENLINAVTKVETSLAFDFNESIENGIDFSNAGTLEGGKLTISADKKQKIAIPEDKQFTITNTESWTLEVVSKTGPGGVILSTGDSTGGFLNIPSDTKDSGNGFTLRDPNRDASLLFVKDVNKFGLKKHLVMTYDKNTKTIKAYEDGVEMTLKNQTGSIETLKPTTFKYLFGGLGEEGKNDFVGEAYYLRYVNRVLDKTEWVDKETK